MLLCVIIGQGDNMSKKKFYEKKMFWIGIGLVGLASGGYLWYRNTQMPQMPLMPQPNLSLTDWDEIYEGAEFLHSQYPCTSVEQFISELASIWGA